MSVQFEVFKKLPSDLHASLKLTEGKQCKWARINCEWVETKTDDTTLRHIYAACINLENGHMYLDCTKKKLFAKCWCLTFIRPLHAIGKTIYHLLLPISIPCEIYKAIQEATRVKANTWDTTKIVVRNLGRNFADIIRTPLYATVLTIITLAGGVIGLLAPHRLYDIREIAGKIETALNWGEDWSFWMLAPCLTFKADLIYTVDYYNKNVEDISDGLSTFAKKQIEFRRHNRFIFNDCWRKLDANKVYRSASYEPQQ